eukprot:m.124946 g.124946  ORF g.124946 m.124946 type:complete len:61 (-) comp29092_c0_seq2:311-493(-)
MSELERIWETTVLDAIEDPDVEDETLPYLVVPDEYDRFELNEKLLVSRDLALVGLSKLAF